MRLEKENWEKELDRISGRMVYSDRIEQEGVSDIKSMFQRLMKGSSYRDISQKEYLEQSEKILEELENKGEEYGRSFNRVLKVPEQPLSGLEEEPYEHVLEGVQKEKYGEVFISYRTEGEEVRVDTWKAKDNQHDAIVADIKTDHDKVPMPEFIEYKEVLKEQGFDYL